MTTVERLREYREHPNISQTELKSLLAGKTKRFKPSLATLIGGYLDCVLLTPEIVDDLYIISDVSRPTDKIVDLCQSLYEWMSYGFIYDEEIPMETDLIKYEGQIEQWIETKDYYNNRPKTRVKTFIKEAEEWWSVLVGKGKKEIITTSEQLDNELICMRLKSDPELDWLWQGEFQKDFYWTEEDIGCKGLGDICTEDYVDLKYTTCTNLKDWIKVCCNLNYPFQMAFYKSGLGFKKGYWLVASKDWHQLVPVSDLMLIIGKYGYRKGEKIRLGSTNKYPAHADFLEKEIIIPKSYWGYLDGLNLLKGEKKKTIEQLYLENL